MEASRPSAPPVLELTHLSKTYGRGEKAKPAVAGVSLDVEWRLGALSIAARYTQGLTDLRMPGESEAVHSRVLTGTGRIALGKKKPKP